jgi:hypothetical protein
MFPGAGGRAGAGQLVADRLRRVKQRGEKRKAAAVQGAEQDRGAGACLQLGERGPRLPGRGRSEFAGDRVQAAAQRAGGAASAVV